jgi:hypothetical protein
MITGGAHRELSVLMQLLRSGEGRGRAVVIPVPAGIGVDMGVASVVSLAVLAASAVSVVVGEGRKFGVCGPRVELGEKVSKATQAVAKAGNMRSVERWSAASAPENLAGAKFCCH